MLSRHANGVGPSCCSVPLYLSLRGRRWHPTNVFVLGGYCEVDKESSRADKGTWAAVTAVEGHTRKCKAGVIILKNEDDVTRVASWLGDCADGELLPLRTASPPREVTDAMARAIDTLGGINKASLAE